MEALLKCCCGVDVHRDMIQPCILKGLTDNPEAIKSEFKTMPDDLEKIIQWLIDNECYHIAMESTGVY